MSNTPQEVAKYLIRDFGKAGALRYAERIARMSGPLSHEYAIAADIIREQISPMCEECGKYPPDAPSHLCQGCEAYKDHTTVY